MQGIRDSYAYYLYRILQAWLSRQWQESLAVRWVTGQTPVHPSVFGNWLSVKLLGFLQNLIRKLKLERLLSGSIFLHPTLFAVGALALAPILPTMGLLALAGAGLVSLLLRISLGQSLSTGNIGRYVLLYAAIYLYATATSATLRGSLLPGLLTTAFVLFYFVVAGSNFTQRQVQQAVAAITLAGVFVALYGFYQMAFPERFRSVWTDTDMFSSITFRVYSTLENPNVLGEYFLLVLPLSAALMLTARTWPGRILCLAACGAMGICLIATYSRGCYLGILLAILLFLILLDRRFLLLAIVAIVLSPLYLPDSVFTRLTSIGNLTDSSTSYRVYIWMGTLAMLKDYWFCGIGPGTAAFNQVYPEYAYNAITAPHSHNLFLQIVCDSGICGILIFLLLIVSFYRMMFTAIHREQDRTARIFQIAGVSAVSGFLLQSMTDYTFYNYRVMLLFWGVLGLCVVFCRMGTSKSGGVS